MRRRTLLTSAVLLCLLGFLAVLVMVVTGTGVVAADQHLSHLLDTGCCTPTQTFWDQLTTVLSPPVDITVLAVTGIVLSIRWRRLEPTLTAVCALALGGGIGLGLKYGVGRPSPYGPVSAEGAFPSGHTLSALVFLGTAVLIASRGRIRPVLIAAVAVATGLVGSGLVYDRYHWLSDVIGSLFLGPVLVYLVTLTPPYRACQRILRARHAAAVHASSDPERAPDDLLHDLGRAAVDRLHT